MFYRMIFFPERCLVTENEVREENVENRGQGSAHVVERDPDILEAQVVGGDHQHKHDRERQDLPHSWQPDFQTVRKTRNFPPGRNSKIRNVLLYMKFDHIILVRLRLSLVSQCSLYLGKIANKA